MVPSRIPTTRLTGITAAVIAAAAAAGLCVGAGTLPAAAAPAETPVGCFGFDAGTGTIDAYLPFAGPENTEPCPTDVIIPDRIDGIAVTGIGDAAFTGAVITSVNLPSTLTRIGDTAFGWLGLAQVTIPDSVTTIGPSAFRGNKLTAAVIPDSVTEMGEAAFAYNPLTSVTIGAGLTHLPASAFEGGELAEAHIPATVTSMDPTVFHSNPISQVTIGDDEYTGKPTLTVPTSAFQTGMLTGAGVTDLHVGANVDTIDALAFFGAPLTGKVTFEEGLTTIGASAFRGAALGELTLPSTVRTIGAQAFWESGLTKITLPSSLTTIGNAALGQNTLTEVSFPNSIETFGDGVLVQNPELRTIHFGDDEYAGPARWDLSGYTAQAFGNTGLSEVTFGPVVRAIADGAFSGNTLKKVTIPGSVASVGDRAFDGGTIGSVTLGAGIQTVGEEAFARNPIAEVTVEGNPVLDRSAFAYSIATADIPDDAKTPAYYTEHASLVRLHATDKTFIGKHEPGFIATSKAGDPVYGYVLNPTTYTVEYLTADGTALRDPEASLVGEGLSGYELHLNPTGDLERYFRAGQDIDLTAPGIAGYDTPKAKTVTLSAGENTFAFTYTAAKADGNPATEGQADTPTEDADKDTAEQDTPPADTPHADDTTDAEATTDDPGRADIMTLSVTSILAGAAIVWLLSQIRLRRNKGL